MTEHPNYDRPLRWLFTQIPHGLWNEPDTTAKEKLLLGWLHSHAPDYRKKLSLARIGREFHGSATYTREELIPSLERKGWLRINPGKPGVAYTVTLLAEPWEALTDRNLTGDQSGSPTNLTGDQSGSPTNLTTDRSGNLTTDRSPLEDHSEDHFPPGAAKPPEEEPRVVAGGLLSAYKAWHYESYGARALVTDREKAAAHQMLMRLLRAGWEPALIKRALVERHAQNWDVWGHLKDIERTLRELKPVRPPGRSSDKGSTRTVDE